MHVNQKILRVSSLIGPIVLTLNFSNWMIFNHWEPSLFWKALNLLKFAASHHKIRSATLLSKIVPSFEFRFHEAFNIFEVQTNGNAYHYRFHRNAPNQKKIAE